MYKKLFLKFCYLNILTIYLLILAGGIVRSTGSGMGCPDWPKCFGSYIPPTSVDELPSNYKEIYASQRLRKNERLAKYLKSFDYYDLAQELIENERVVEEQPFNATKTWIEYINRLLGALLGFFLIIAFVLSLSYYKKNKVITGLAALSLLLTAFQGWIGSIVVSSNLLPGLITFHMILAVVIIGLIITTTILGYRSDQERPAIIVENRKLIMTLILLALVTQLIQIAFGTQVREQVDVLLHQMSGVIPNNWLELLGNRFKIHRSFSWLLILVNGFLIFNILKHSSLPSSWLYSAKALILVIGFEIFIGVGMAYFEIPAFLQPLHLLFATIIFGLQVFLFLAFKFARQKIL